MPSGPVTQGCWGWRHQGSLRYVDEHYMHCMQCSSPYLNGPARKLVQRQTCLPQTRSLRKSGTTSQYISTSNKGSVPSESETQKQHHNVSCQQEHFSSSHWGWKNIGTTLGDDDKSNTAVHIKTCGWYEEKHMAGAPCYAHSVISREALFFHTVHNTS